MDVCILFATNAQIDAAHFCNVFPQLRFIPAWTHGIRSHSLFAKQQQPLLCMIMFLHILRQDSSNMPNLTAVHQLNYKICINSHLVLVTLVYNLHLGRKQCVS